MNGAGSVVAIPVRLMATPGSVLDDPGSAMGDPCSVIVDVNWGPRPHQPRSPRGLRRNRTFQGEPAAANTNLRSPRGLSLKPKIVVSPKT